MINARLRIDLEKDLPFRAASLGPAALSQVFGGCGQANVSCTTDQDCCSQTYTIPGTSISYALRCRLTSFNPPRGTCGWM